MKWRAWLDKVTGWDTFLQILFVIGLVIVGGLLVLLQNCA
jgi:hypothetical protein